MCVRAYVCVHACVRLCVDVLENMCNLHIYIYIDYLIVLTIDGYAEVIHITFYFISY